MSAVSVMMSCADARRRSSCCTASPGPAARGTASPTGSTRNATGRSRPTSAATARRATRGRSTFDACVGRRRSRAAPERFVLVRLLAGRPDRAARRARGARSASTRLVLVATTAGHRGRRRARARAARPTSALAADIERGTIEAFADRWSAPAAVRRRRRRAARALWRADLPAQRPGRRSPRRCAGSAPARWTPLWDRLGELTMPVTLVVGERDGELRRARAAHRGRAARTRGCSSCPGAGHGLPREAPQARGGGDQGDRVTVQRDAGQTPSPGASGTAISPLGTGEDLELARRTARACRARTGARAQRGGAVHARRRSRAGRRRSRRGRRRRPTRATSAACGEQARDPAAARRPSGRPRRRRRASARPARRPSRPSRSRTGDAVAHRAQRRDRRGPAPRRARARPARAPRSCATASSTSHAPLASRRSAISGPGRGAHRGDAPGVVADADLDLHAASSPRARPRRPPRPRRRGPRRRSSR